MEPRKTVPQAQPAPRTRSRDHQVEDLLQRFGRALTAGQGEAAADCWETPAFVLSDEGAHAVAARDEVVGFFSGARAQYKAKGISDTRPEIERLEWVTDRMALVDVRWPWLDADGAENGEESSTYALRRGDDGRLKIRMVVMHGAREDTTPDH